MKYILLFLFIFAFISCRKKFTPCTYKYTCQRISIVPLFDGFGAGEIDSIILSTYKKQSAYQSPISTKIFIQPDSTFNYAYTSPIYYKNGFAELYLYPGFDYRITIPKTGSVFDIYNVDDTGLTQTYECGWKGSCCTQLTSVSVSGGTYRFTGGNLFFIYLNLKK